MNQSTVGPWRRSSLLLASAFALAVVFAGLPRVASAQSDGRLPPTEVLYLSLSAMERNPTTPRLEAIGSYYRQMQTEGLTEHEKFAAAEVYFLNFKPREALAAYRPFMSGDDMQARIAWQKVMQIQFAAFDEVALVERLIGEFNERFPPNDKDMTNAEWQIFNLARLYRSRGEHQKVVDLITAEIERLPDGLPYRALRLPGLFMESFAAVGKADAAREMLTDAQSSLEIGFAEFLGAHPSGIVTHGARPQVAGRYYRMEEGLTGIALEPGYPSAEHRAHQYQVLLHELGYALWRVRAESAPQ